MSCIHVYGQPGFFDVFQPDPKMITPEGLAVQLSRRFRFGAATTESYTVAEHSVVVSRLCRRHALKLAALLHDASEAYLGDLNTPIKKLPGFAPFRYLESRIQAATARRFGIPESQFNEPAVHDADRLALEVEATRFMPQWDPATFTVSRRRRERLAAQLLALEPKEAAKLWLAEYRRLTLGKL